MITPVHDLVHTELWDREAAERKLLLGQLLQRIARSLAVGLARIWRSGKSEEAAKTAQSYTVEYERAVGCDLRWVAGRAGPGVWDGTVSLVRSLREITPYVGRAREAKAVVVTAVICPHEREAPRLKQARGEQRPSRRSG